MHILKISQANPGAGYAEYKKEIDRAVKQVLDSGSYILGKQVQSFENNFSSFIGAKFAVGVASGTDALYLALKACGVLPGEGVITVSHTSSATVAAIMLAQAVPVLVDIDPLTFTMNPEYLEEALKKYKRKYRIKAVIPVHLYGCPADMPVIMNISGRYDLRVIEDCAQSHGAEIEDKKTGNWGDVAAFSFYPTKNLGCFGDAGAIVTNDSRRAECARNLREYGWKKRYISMRVGSNSRLDELQAAVLNVKLRHINKDNARRRCIAAFYNSRLSALPLFLPACGSEVRHVFHQYVIRSPQRDRLKEFLASKNIATSIHYPLPVHLQPGFAKSVKLGSKNLSCTETVCKQILSLPIYPQMSEEQLMYVTKSIKEREAD